MPTPRPDALGSRFSSGTSTSSMRIIPVAEALKENFPSIFGVERPFMPRSKIKPRTFPSSHLAQTTAISATGELVILKEKANETLSRHMTTFVCFFIKHTEHLYFIVSYCSFVDGYTIRNQPVLTNYKKCHDFFFGGGG